MKKITLPLIIGFLSVTGLQAQEIEKDLDHFDRLIVSPHIDLVIRQGDQPHIRLAYSGIDREEIHIEENGNSLKVFLDQARYVEKNKSDDEDYYRKGVYAGAKVTAYVTYSQLEYLEFRGNGMLTALTAIEADNFKLKAYGENIIEIPELQANYFKLSLYGENELYIRGGTVDEQKISLYGENLLDITGLKSQTTSTNVYGSSEMRITATNEFQINSFGEPRITYSGEPVINKKIIIGEPTIHQIRN